MAIELVKEGRLAIITINRPRVMNALDAESGRQLHQALGEFGSNPELWVGIVTGAGEKAFCTGADIRDLLPAIEEQALPASPVGGLEAAYRRHQRPGAGRRAGSSISL